MEMLVGDDGADAVMAQKIAPLHGLQDRSYRSNRRSADGVDAAWRHNKPLGGVKKVARGEVGRAAVTLGVTRTPPQSRIAAK
jgi:hypothetical protein